MDVNAKGQGELSTSLKENRLIDLGFVGPAFTWKRGSLLEKDFIEP